MKTINSLNKLIKYTIFIGTIAAILSIYFRSHQTTYRFLSFEGPASDFYLGLSLTAFAVMCLELIVLLITWKVNAKKQSDGKI